MSTMMSNENDVPAEWDEMTEREKRNYVDALRAEYLDECSQAERFQLEGE